jgi:hypothetical protein
MLDGVSTEAVRIVPPPKSRQDWRQSVLKVRIRKPGKSQHPTGGQDRGHIGAILQEKPTITTLPSLKKTDTMNLDGYILRLI